MVPLESALNSIQNKTWKWYKFVLMRTLNQKLNNMYISFIVDLVNKCQNAQYCYQYSCTGCSSLFYNDFAFQTVNCLDNTYYCQVIK